jgi:hypothetical protein
MFPTDRAWCPQGVMVLLQILYRPCCLFWRQLQDDSRAHILTTYFPPHCSVKACRCVAQTASGSFFDAQGCGPGYKGVACSVCDDG